MFIRLLICSTLIIGLAACTQVPIRSMFALRKPNIETTDFSKFNAIARLPISVQPTEKSLKFQYQHEQENGTVIGHAFHPIISQDPEVRRQAAAFQKAGTQVWAYELSAEDQLQVNRDRQQIIAANTKDSSGELNVSVSLSKLCRAKPIDLDRDKATIWIRTSESGKFVMLIRPTSIRKIIDATTEAPISGGQTLPFSLQDCG